MTGTIAIVFHAKDRGGRYRGSMIMQYVEYWREWGLTVHLLFGTREYRPADVGILHVDLSVVPPKYVEFVRRYPVALNAGVTDIRKSTFSTARLAAEDSYSEPVIVKSNLNYGGLPERWYAPLPVKAWHRLRDSIGRSASRLKAPHQYRVYPSLAEVPRSSFTDPRVIVEKFIPEIEGEYFCVRTCIFLGERRTWHRLRSRSAVVKAGSNNFESADLEPQVIEMQRALNFDYGKFDYVLHDGVATLLDCNKTVGGGWGRSADTPQLRAMRRHRAEGIIAFLQ